MFVWVGGVTQRSVQQEVHLRQHLVDHALCVESLGNLSNNERTRADAMYHVKPGKGHVIQ